MSRKERINQLLSEELQPELLTVEDESNQHQVPEGAETHFKLTIVAKQFSNLPRIERHRLVNKLITKEFNAGLHALSLNLYTPEEWANRGSPTPASPACRGGYRHG